MRASERLMVIELALEGELVTFVSVYAPQVDGMKVVERVFEKINKDG